MDEHLTAVVALLGGPFTPTRAAECGVTTGQLRRAVARRELVIARPGVLVDAGLHRAAATDATLAARIDAYAAVLATGGDTVVSHRSAAAIRGWALLGAAPVRPQLLRTRQPGRTPSTSELKSVRVARLPDDHCTTVPGVPSTSDARTLVDIARSCPSWTQSSLPTPRSRTRVARTTSTAC